jgi:hypothetical protein
MAPSDLLRTISYAISADGQTVELRFSRKDGTIAKIQCAYGNLPDVISQIERAAKEAWEIQSSSLGGFNPRDFYPVTAKKVKTIEGGKAKDGTPVVTLVLTTGVRLALTVDRNAISDLIAWLEELQKFRPKSPRRDH